MINVPNSTHCNRPTHCLFFLMAAHWLHAVGLLRLVARDQYSTVLRPRECAHSQAARLVLYIHAHSGAARTLSESNYNVSKSSDHCCRRLFLSASGVPAEPSLPPDSPFSLVSNFDLFLSLSCGDEAVPGSQTAPVPSKSKAAGPLGLSSGNLSRLPITLSLLRTHRLTAR